MKGLWFFCVFPVLIYAAGEKVVWLHPASESTRSEMRNDHYEPSLASPELQSGVWTSGNARFRIPGSGEQIVEIFLIEQSEKPSSFVVEQSGRIIDETYRVRPGPLRLSPRGRARYIGIVAAANPGELILKTDSPRYVFQTARAVARAEFEASQVPRLRDRLRHWLANPIFGIGERGASKRKEYLEQLGARLLLSRDADVSNEGLLALTRASYWIAAENHQPYEIDRTAELFREGLKRMPASAVLRQMISASCLSINSTRMPEGDFCEQVAPLPWNVHLPPPPPGAPAWAVEQRKLARRMDAITRWWVENRQQENGELGGGWGDDVEILRSWGPQALGFGSDVALRGLRKLADGLWSSGALLHGYSRGISDVEHSSEPSTDTLPLRAAAFSDDEAGRARLAQTAACFPYWVAEQPDGFWRFRSSWFNCREHDPKPDRALDVHLNTRAAGPVLWHAYFSRNPEIIRLLANWGESWVNAMRSTAHGKPAGIFPSVLKSADGSYLIGSEAWDKPLAEWDYFQWSGGSQEALTSLMLALHELTGKRKWLELAGESFAVMERCESYPHLCDAIRQAPEAFYEWRRRTRNPRYDAAFKYAGQPSRTAILDRMAGEARAMDAHLGVNFDMYTREVIWTDRVYYRWTADYRQRLFGGEAPRGDRYPTFAVTWPAANAEFARAVIAADDRQLELALYAFEEAEVSIPVRLWRLAAGKYRWEARASDGTVVTSGTFTISNLPQLIEFRVPGRKELFVRVTAGS